MLFRSLWVIILATSLLACTEERIDSPKTRVGENPRVEQEVEQQEIQQDLDLGRLEKLVNSDNLVKQEEAFKELSQYIYGPKGRDPNQYSTPAYRSRLLLLTHLIKKWKKSSSEKTQQKVVASLSQFKNHFLTPCLDGDCSLVKDVLKRENSSVHLILMIADNTSKLKDRLNILGLAFDISGKRKNEALLKAYTETTIAFSKQNSQIKNNTFLRKHLVNVSQLFEYADWEGSDQWLDDYFIEIQPWKLNNSNSKDVWNIFRTPLLKKLFSFYSSNKQVKNKIHSEIDNVLSKLKKDQFDLEQYPAYKGISLSEEKTFLNFIALKFFSGEYDVTQLNEIYSRLPEEHKDIDKMFKLFNRSIRWQIAQLGLDSTKILSEKAATYPFKSKIAIQEILDAGQDLVPRWSYFHSIQKSGIRKFLSTNIFESKKYSADDIDNFIKAIDRNIYRAVVYPNMLALGYFMTQSDWEDEVKIWFWTFKINTDKVMDRLLTGQYPFPWYTFTDLKDLQTINGDYTHLVQADHKTRRTLYRSEMYDSLYYLFATKTHQAYNIDSDRLLQTFFEKSGNKRFEMMEDTVNIQSRVYLNGNTEIHAYLNWCQNIKSRSATNERLDFYDVLSVNIPFLGEIKGMDGIGRYPFYYDDLYMDTRHATASQMFVINDIFRLEFLPIIEFASHSLEIAKNLQKDNPGLIKSNWKKSSAYINQLDRMKKAYIGSQLAVRNLISDCQFVGQEESKRRSREMVKAEKRYQEELVFPVLAKVSKGEITTQQANDFFKSLHDNSELYEDSVNNVSKGTVSVMIHRTTFAYRVRKLYKYGFNVDHPYVGKVNIPAVIGEDLKMPIPANFMEKRGKDFKDRRNDFITSSTKAFDYHPSTTKEEFSSSIISSIYMQMRNKNLSDDEFVTWDRMSAGIISDNDNGKRHMQFFATFHQLGEFEYYDYSKKECRDYSKENSDCLRKGQVSFQEATDHIDRWFNQYLLEDSDRHFFSLTGEKEYMNDDSIDFITLFDAGGLMKNFKDEAIRDDILYYVTDLPYKKLNGYHDLLREMIDADHLGIIFKTSIDINLETDKSTDYTCWSQRRECNWGSDRSYAREFHTARTERAGIFFNFDKRILERDYRYVKKRVSVKYDLLRALQEQGDGLLTAVRENQKTTGTVHMDIPEAPLHSLTSRNRKFEKDFSEFFKEETGSFYLSEPNWENYLDPEVNWIKSK